MKGTFVGGETHIKNVNGRTRREHFGGLGVDGKVIIKCILEKQIQYRGQWQALVNTVMIPRVPSKTDNVLIR
jgi:hypothetical protein